MGRSNRYAILGISIVVIAGIFVFFTDPNNIRYDHTGIVSDVDDSEKGYTFHLHDAHGNDIRCFSYERPVELGYYAVSGELSDDGNIFFVSVLRNLDVDPF